MDIRDFQKLSSDIVSKIDDKFNLDRDVQLNISQLLEELGELAQVANLKKLRNKEPEKKDLEDEFADVFLQFATLASSFDVDLEKSVLDKIEVLKKRHSL
jgi:NTP pyrophosphatase (non-canonical NTP hydrolase)